MSPVQDTSTPASSSLSFTQGLLLGQASIALLIFFFIKFVIFGEPSTSDERASALFSARRARSLSYSLRSPPLPSLQNSPRTKSSTVLRSPQPLTTAAILAKTYYNVAREPESVDWFNVLVAQTLAQLRADALADSAILTSLTNLLNGPSKPDFLSEIKITEISLGEEFPIFSNCRVIPISDSTAATAGTSSAGGGGARPGSRDGPTDSATNSRLQARMDVDLSDFITLGIETKLVLNYPKPFSAVLPIALAVSVVRFSGTLSISFVPTAPPQSSCPPTHPASYSTDEQPNPKGNTTLTFSFLDDYRLDLSVTSLIGSRSRLQDIPKIAQLVEARVHQWFDERCVEPRFQQIVLPSFWPRKRTARGGDGHDEAGAADGGGADAATVPVAELQQEQEQKYQRGINREERARIDKPLPQTPPSHAAEGNELLMTAEERHLAAEGDKIREAERRAENAERQREERNSAGEGVRWRGGGMGSREREREGIPGGMPGTMVS